MDDLTEFVAERLDEDEAAAGKAIGTDWLQAIEWVVDGVVHVAQANSVRTAIHIARHDPARVLRGIEAKRRLVAEVTAIRHEYVEGDSWFSCSQARSEWREDAEPGSGCADDDRAGKPCDCGRDKQVAAMLGMIASEWSDHEQYKPQWKPEG